MVRSAPEDKTVKYQEKVEYIHLNPVKTGWVDRPEDGPWLSVYDYRGNLNDTPITPSDLSVDRITIPADPRTQI